MTDFVKNNNNHDLVMKLIYKKLIYNDLPDKYKLAYKNKFKKDYDDIPTKEVKLPYSTICGNLNWKMSYNNIIIHIRKIFYKLKENNQIINYSEFKSRFTYTDKHKNFRKIYVDINGKKWIENDNDLTRVFGSNFIKKQNTEFDAPEQLIVCNSQEFADVTINFKFRDVVLSGSRICKYPPPFPILKNIQNGFILSEYIENGRPICNLNLLKQYPVLGENLGFIDFKHDNILLKEDKKWIVDCEMFSFIFCRSVLLYGQKINEIDLDKFNFEKFNENETLYYFFKFLIDNNKYIESRILPLILNQENNDYMNLLLIECLRKMEDGFINLQIPLD